MKAKLIKKGDVYFLDELKIDGYFTIANSLAKPNGLMYNLSIKNCQAIKLGYDLAELISESDTSHLALFTSDSHGLMYDEGFKAGFQKSLELMGDKKFSEDFLKRMCSISFNFYKRNDLSDCELEKEWENWLKNSIQPLQQTEWDVEFNPEELDADGCLILKRI